MVHHVKKRKNVSEFQSRVYAAVKRIPSGKVASYATIATAIGCPSPRAIGQAMRCCTDNTVPCHRVVAAGGLLGGYGGRAAGSHVRRKMRRLMAEGVRFDKQDRIEPGHVLRDSPRTHRLLSGR